jgi:hypothetical protein
MDDFNIVSRRSKPQPVDTAHCYEASMTSPLWTLSEVGYYSQLVGGGIIGAAQQIGVFHGFLYASHIDYEEYCWDLGRDITIHSGSLQGTVIHNCNGSDVGTDNILYWIMSYQAKNPSYAPTTTFTLNVTGSGMESSRSAELKLWQEWQCDNPNTGRR